MAPYTPFLLTTAGETPTLERLQGGVYLASGLPWRLTRTEQIHHVLVTLSTGERSVLGGNQCRITFAAGPTIAFDPLHDADGATVSILVLPLPGVDDEQPA